jgi:hypothetical protein
MEQTMSFGPAPPLKHFSLEKNRTMITMLRDKAAPILANNLLPHFTDHSVAHSDNVTKLVDNLLEWDEPVLNDQELVILYSACYLHDIGMQYERAGETDVVSSLSLIPPWDERSESDKRDLLRTFHNRISAEMVQKSVYSASPPIGFQLTSEFNASYIARLCHAHCLPIDTSEYSHLVEDGPNIRMSLLSGLLRLADILDESRRRATCEKERTLELDLESQTHWWRHHYTEDVSFDCSNRVITIWFDFPSARLAEYERIVPLLQMPQIEAEFRYHASALVKNGLGWSLRHKSKDTPYGSAKEMPEEVLTAMLTQLARRRRVADEEHRLLALGQFREARPSIERRLKALNDRESSMDLGDYLLELGRISFDLFELGGRRSARSALHRRYLTHLHLLTLDDRLRVGLRLLEWLLDDGQAFEATKLVEALAPSAQPLPQGDGRKWEYTRLKILALTSANAYDEVKAELRSALEWAPHEAKASLAADLAEIMLLQGDFGRDEEA